MFVNPREAAGGGVGGWGERQIHLLVNLETCRASVKQKYLLQAPFHFASAEPFAFFLPAAHGVAHKLEKKNLSALAKLRASPKRLLML